MIFMKLHDKIIPMKRIFFSLLILMYLNSCKSENVVGKKILCGSLSAYWNIISFEFISADSVKMRSQQLNESIFNDNETYKYKLRPKEIIISFISPKKNEHQYYWIYIINREDLSIFEVADWMERKATYDKDECRVIKGDIGSNMKKLEAKLILQKENNNENSFFRNKFINFFDSFFYKI